MIFIKGSWVINTRIDSQLLGNDPGKARLYRAGRKGNGNDKEFLFALLILII